MRVLLFALLGCAMGISLKSPPRMSPKSFAQITTTEGLTPPKSVEELLAGDRFWAFFDKTYGAPTTTAEKMKLLPKATSKFYKFQNRYSKRIGDYAYNEAKSFAEQAQSQQVRQNLQGKHIVFMGDSVSRYQYLNLAHHALHGKGPATPFFEHDLAPEARDAATHWNLWYNESNKLLKSPNGWEICDCWKGDTMKGEVVENRFLVMPETGAAITYLPWLDDKQTFTGHWSPNQGYPIETGCEPGSCSAHLHRYGSHGEKGTVDFLYSYVMKLKPTPTHVIMNRGLWGGQLSEQTAENLFAAGEQLKKKYPNTNFIWKTTTQNLLDLNDDGHRNEIEREIKQATAHGWKVLNLFKQSNDIEAWYVDPVHVNEQGSAYYNSLLMKLL